MNNPCQVYQRWINKIYRYIESIRNTNLFSCASVAAAPPCRLVVNASAAYPFCCPRYDCSRLVAEADAKENEVDTGEDDDDDGDVMYMSGSHPAVDYESVQYDVDLGGDSDTVDSQDDDAGVRGSLQKVSHA